MATKQANEATLHGQLSVGCIVIDELQRDVAKLIDDTFEGSIHIDAIGFPNKGRSRFGLKDNTAAGWEQ